MAVAAGESDERLSSFAAALNELRRHEDVDGPALPVDGRSVMAALSLKPGPDIGRALAFLRELTFDEGPLSRTEALDALRQWRATDYSAGP